MVAAAEVAAHGFGGAVLQQAAVVVAEESVKDGRLDKNASGAAGNDEMLRIVAAEQLVKVGAVEGAEASLVDDRLAVFGCQFVDDVGAPLVAGQDPVLYPEVEEQQTVGDIF